MSAHATRAETGEDRSDEVVILGHSGAAVYSLCQTACDERILYLILVCQLSVEKGPTFLLRLTITCSYCSASTVRSLLGDM